MNTQEIQPPPPPWQKVGVAAVGGLIMVGFAEDSDLLLVLSHDGAGVFDATCGARIARDALAHGSPVRSAPDRRPGGPAR